MTIKQLYIKPSECFRDTSSIKSTLIWICLIGLLASCKKDDVQPSIQRNWIMKTVRHKSNDPGKPAVVVYERGAANNIATAYKNFNLDLSKQDTLSFTDIDQDGSVYKFIGKWRVDKSVKLVLYNLKETTLGVPPSCEDCDKNGIEYFIVSIAEDQLIVNRLYTSDKTGDTLNEYILEPK